MRAGWLFFSLFAFHAMPGRFLSIFYQQHNLDETQIGIILSVPTMISMFSSPVICGFADRTGNREKITAVTFAISTLSFLAQIPALPSLNLFSPSSRFWYLLLLRCLGNVFRSGVYPLVSAITIAQLKHKYGEKGHERFGQERLFGAVSWAVVALSLGAVLDLPNVEIWIIHVGIVFFSLTFLLSLFVFVKANKVSSEEDASQVERSDLLTDSSDRERADQVEEVEANTREEQPASETRLSSIAVMLNVVCGGGIKPILFFNLIFWLAIGMSLVENLLFLFFENELHASNLVCGISVLITVVFEIPIFAKAPYLLNKLGAPMLAMMGSSAFVIRGIGYALAPNAWSVLSLEPLHGVTYGMFHTAAVAYIADRTLHSYEATGQSLLSVFQGLGKTLGPSFGGYIMQQFGSKVMYGGAAVLVLIATLAFGVVERLWNRHEDVNDVS